MQYILGIVLKTYEEFERRFKLIGKEKLTSPDRVLAIMRKSLSPLSKKDIMILCPDISQRTVEKSLKKLTDAKKIKQVDSGRSTKYTKV